MRYFLILMISFFLLKAEETCVNLSNWQGYVYYPLFSGTRQMNSCQIGIPNGDAYTSSREYNKPNKFYYVHYNLIYTYDYKSSWDPDPNYKYYTVQMYTISDPCKLPESPWRLIQPFDGFTECNEVLTDYQQIFTDAKCSFCPDSQGGENGGMYSAQTPNCAEGKEYDYSHGACVPKNCAPLPAGKLTNDFPPEQCNEEGFGYEQPAGLPYFYNNIEYDYCLNECTYDKAYCPENTVYFYLGGGCVEPMGENEDYSDQCDGVIDRVSFSVNVGDSKKCYTKIMCYPTTGSPYQLNSSEVSCGTGEDLDDKTDPKDPTNTEDPTSTTTQDPKQNPCDDLYDKLIVKCAGYVIGYGDCEHNGKEVTKNTMKCVTEEDYEKSKEPTPADCADKWHEVYNETTKKCECESGYNRNTFGDCWKSLLDSNATQEQINKEIRDQENLNKDLKEAEKTEGSLSSIEKILKNIENTTSGFRSDINTTNRILNDILAEVKKQSDKNSSSSSVVVNPEEEEQEENNSTTSSSGWSEDKLKSEIMGQFDKRYSIFSTDCGSPQFDPAVTFMGLTIENPLPVMHDKISPFLQQIRILVILSATLLGVMSLFRR